MSTSTIAWLKNPEVRTVFFTWVLIAGVCVVIANVIAAVAQ